MKVLILQQGQWESICELLSGLVILSQANVCHAVQEGQIIILLSHSRFSSFTFMTTSLICKMHSTIETHPLLLFCSCVNGNCTSPSSCSCYPGWTGPHCTQICRLLIIIWSWSLMRRAGQDGKWKVTIKVKVMFWQYCTWLWTLMTTFSDDDDDTTCGGQYIDD